MAVAERADRLPVHFQRAESLFVAALTAAAFVEFGFAWWWEFCDAFGHTGRAKPT